MKKSDWALIFIACLATVLIIGLIRCGDEQKEPTEVLIIHDTVISEVKSDEICSKYLRLLDSIDRRDSIDLVIQ